MQGNIFTRVVTDVKFFDEVDEVMSSFFALADHPVGDEIENCELTMLVGGEFFIFNHDCDIKRRGHGCLEVCFHPTVAL